MQGIDNDLKHFSSSNMEHFRTANTAPGIWNTYFHDPVISNRTHRLGVWRYCPQPPPHIFVILWDIVEVIPTVTVLEMSYMGHAQ